ncbi:MAG: hypothetical protein ACYDBJ_17480 [Aggregatilineales bacterium]
MSRLSGGVWTRTWFRWFASNPGGLEGSVSKDGFYINRIVNYRNSFLPFVRGKFFPEQDRLRIELTATFHPVVIAILASFVVFIIDFGIKDGYSWNGLAGACAMILVEYSIIMFIFVYELQKTKKRITEILGNPY